MTVWTDEKHNELVRLVQEYGRQWTKLAEAMAELYQEEFYPHALRMHYRDYVDGYVKKRPAAVAVEEPVLKADYKETTELKNGVWHSDKLIAMSEADMKDTDFLLRAHGFDPNEWELVSAKSSLWHQRNKKDAYNTSDIPVMLYSNRITVRPKIAAVDWDAIVARIAANTEPYLIESEYEYEGRDKHLVIPLLDMHFGNNTYEDYLDTQQRIIDLLENNYSQVLFVLGNDLFHHNDLRNHTASGREIAHMDMTKAWEWATDFYEPLLAQAALKSESVRVVYVYGNHDESLAWAFTKSLESRFPGIAFDSSFRARKAVMLGKNMIAMTHGDRAVKNLTPLFAHEYPYLWAEATNRECFIGHLHSEKVEDKEGMTIRRMPTRNKIDGWHEENGYTMAARRFEVIEYSETDTEAIYYV